MIIRLFAAMSICSLVVFSSSGQEKKPVATSAKQETKVATTAAKTKSAVDTLVVKAQLEEIPGTMPGNDLYNYVYIMKYKVVSVVKGVYSEKEILVGQYNPLIARGKVKDRMDQFVNGTVEKFEMGAYHKLTLITPIETVWKDAVEDEYFDSELPKYFAVQTDVTQK